MIQSKKRTLLIAEDEPILLEALVELTSALDNVQILTAKNGQESYDIIKSQSVDTVLSDINMPKINGIEVLSKIRLEKIDIPYIILSGFGDKSNLAKAITLGATDFLDKPFDDEELLKVLDKSLNLGVSFKNIIGELQKLVDQGKLDPTQFEDFKSAKIAMAQIRMTNQFKPKFE